MVHMVLEHCLPGGIILSPRSNNYHHQPLWLIPFGMTSTSWHLMIVRVDICCVIKVPSSDTCLVGYELTSNDGTSWHLLVVRVSWHGYELTWVRVDIYCVVIDVNSYHHFILTLWYELTSVGGTIWHGYELTWVRVDMGTSWPVFNMPSTW